MQNLLSVNFCWGQLLFLNHVISCEGVEVYPKKTDELRNWPRPLTATDIRSFLCLAGYCRRFLYGFFPLLLLWHSLPKIRWSWSGRKLVIDVSKSWKIRLPLPQWWPKGSEGFLMYCYASWMGLGCVLMKHGNVISYSSRQLNVQQKNYKSHDPELAAIMLSWKWGHITCTVFMLICLLTIKLFNTCLQKRI